MNDKHEMLYAANKLRDVLSCIEDLLEGYEGTEGNKNYVKYCFRKAKEAHTIDDDLVKMIEDTYAIDTTQRRGINIAILNRIIEKMFRLLDDIDTASDMFKPKWCKVTKAVSELQGLRWRYCTADTVKNENGDMVINGEGFTKENRIILNIS
jgi:vesicle coat complex subunit